MFIDVKLFTNRVFIFEGLSCAMNDSTSFGAVVSITYRVCTFHYSVDVSSSHTYRNNCP